MGTARERGRTARMLGALGAAGPVAFTVAWALGGSVQERYYPGREYISALASTSAQSPGIMIAGFIAAGLGFVALGAALRLAGDRWRPDAVLLAGLGVAIAAAGLLRADCSVALEACLRRDATWHASAHGVLATVIFLALVALPLIFARVHRREGTWTGLRRAGLLTSAVCAVLLILLALEAWPSAAGSLQRLFVTVAFGWIASVGIRIARRPTGAVAPAS